jgi:hypothetical protein
MNPLAERKAALKARIDAIEETDLLEAVEAILAEAAAVPDFTPEELAELKRRSKETKPEDWIPLENVLAEARARYTKKNE